MNLSSPGILNVIWPPKGLGSAFSLTLLSLAHTACLMVIVLYNCPTTLSVPESAPLPEVSPGVSPDHHNVGAGLQATIAKSRMPQNAPLNVLSTSKNDVQIKIDHAFGLTWLSDKSKAYSCESQMTGFL